jgi:hypothetical protein
VPTESIPDAAETSAWADEHTVTFRLADPGHELAGVRLAQDVRIPGDRLGFHRSGDGWELVIDRPPVNRMDSRERWVSYYRRVVRFVADVTSGGRPSRPVPAVLTCGSIEELLGQASR